MSKITIPTLPPGFQKDTVEIYRTAKFKADAIYNGEKTNFNALPAEIKEIFEIDLIKHKKAFNFLSNMFETSDEMLEAYVSCRYGNFDSVADLNGKELTPDIPSCGIEYKCPGYGIICVKPQGLEDNLSLSEIKIIKHIIEGKEDKQIAFLENISINTVRTHTTRIREKLNVNNRTEIAIWAKKHNI